MLVDVIRPGGLADAQGPRQAHNSEGPVDARRCTKARCSSLLPPNFAAAEALKETLARRQFAPSQAGQDLTRALLDIVAYTLPGDVFRNAPPALTQHFLGQPWAGWLGVNAGILAEALCAPLEVFGLGFGALTERSGVLRILAQKGRPPAGSGNCLGGERRQPALVQYPGRT